MATLLLLASLRSVNGQAASPDLRTGLPDGFEELDEIRGLRVFIETPETLRADKRAEFRRDIAAMLDFCQSVYGPAGEFVTVGAGGPDFVRIDSSGTLRCGLKWPGTISIGQEKVRTETGGSLRIRPGEEALLTLEGLGTFVIRREEAKK